MPAIQNLARMLLAAHLLLSPLVFCRATTEAFESNKVLLLVSVATVLVALGFPALIKFLTATWHGQRCGWNGGILAAPDLSSAGVLLFVLSGTLSTMFSISPHTSWRGGHDSYAGLVTVVGYAVLFFSTRLLF